MIETCEQSSKPMLLENKKTIYYSTATPMHMLQEKNKADDPLGI
jgi:hypothetical protein